MGLLATRSLVMVGMRSSTSTSVNVASIEMNLRGRTLQSELGEPGVIVGPASQWPAVLPISFRDRQIVDAREAPRHVACSVELPVLVAVGAEPVADIVVPFVREPHRDAIAAKGP